MPMPGAVHPGEPAPPAAGGENAPEETVVVDEATRMRINGESKGMMNHGKAIKADRTDTTVDDVWEPDPKLSFTDAYVKYTTYGYLLPKVVLLGPFLYLLCAPIAFLGKRFAMRLPRKTDAVDRRTWAFFFYRLFAMIHAVPLAPLVLLSYALDMIMYYALSVPYCLLGCHAGRYAESLKAMAPYKGGPRIRFDDVLVCVAGQARRNGACEVGFSLGNMFVAVPWLKYYVNANPWLYPLKERFIQQISTSWQDMDVDRIMEEGRAIISRTAQTSDVTERLDLWEFLPHYPYPPPGRRWAIGLQHVNQACMLVHTTHAVASAEGSQEQYILSNSVHRPVWRVMLWYNNPYHFLTGWVEASITNGQPSQLDKKHGGEHPMWLVTSNSPALLDRNHWGGGPGTIDKFFDRWLPVLTDEVRARIRGPDVARQMHQEVISKDGISRPAAKVGVGVDEEVPEWNPAIQGKPEA